MKEPAIKNYGLEFGYLIRRLTTDMIIVHHTGNLTDDNLSAKQLHISHLGLGWSGVGYHYIIRKDGTIEAGRPEWAQGAHAEEYNTRSVAVHLCGNFEYVKPTDVQIEQAAYLIGWICEKYGLVPDKNHVYGHRDLLATTCPGRYLYDRLQDIRGKAIWYQQHY